MSRCFPFPPPGYEKKPRPEDSSVLKEEKQREKKQKKEKKDKEKREGKDKKDKERRSDGKHRQKKDRKEKPNDKNDKRREKKKERSKDKDKSSTSEMSKVTGFPETKGVEKLNAEDGNSYYAEKKNYTAQSYGQNGDKTAQSSLLAWKTEESKFVQELDRRIRVVEKITGNELVEKFSGLDRKRDDGVHRFAASNPGNLAEEKGKSREKQSDNKKMDGHGTFSGNTMVHNIAGTTQGKIEGIPKVVEKNDERRLGEKEKTKERGDDKRGDKYMDKDRDKKSHGTDKDTEKERKKEMVKERSEHKKHDQEKPGDVSRSGLIGIIDNKRTSLSSDLYNNANVEGNLKKRKVDINGFLHDTEVRPNKLQRSTSHQVVENGRKLEACQVPSLLTSGRQAGAAMLKVDEKESRKNGITESLPFPATKPKSSSATADVDETAATSRKPPHPDSKYLSQVLSVPKMDECSEFDDQEWLFTSQDPTNRKVCASGVGEELQVWSKALHIESADVIALPYVIPY